MADFLELALPAGRIALNHANIARVIELTDAKGPTGKCKIYCLGGFTLDVNTTYDDIMEELQGELVEAGGEAHTYPMDSKYPPGVDAAMIEMLPGDLAPTTCPDCKGDGLSRSSELNPSTGKPFPCGTCSGDKIIPAWAAQNYFKVNGGPRGKEE